MEEQEEGRRCENEEEKIRTLIQKKKKSDATDNDSSEKLLWQNCPDC